MEDHMHSSDTAGTGSSSVTMVTDSLGTEADLRVLCNRVEVLEQRAGSVVQSDSYLRNRIRELERSERSLLLQLYQIASASQPPGMQHSQRLDQRLHTLREEVRTMAQEKERGEQVWRDRLQRCQRQLKSKEEEMSRQSQYFENYKTQLQHKLSLARDREQSLQNRIFTLEKQLLDMTVSAATGMATVRAVRITAGTVTHLEEQDKLPCMRGEGEGEEEKKEERRKQWQTTVGTERDQRQEGDEGKTENSTQGGGNKDIKQTSNEARLQGFIISLQEDLRVLLEREEERMTERRKLMEQLQEAQENGHFLGCKVEEMKEEVHQLKLSESSLLEEVEELREENQRLQQILRDAANQTPSQSSTCGSPRTSCSPAVCSVPANSYTTATGHLSPGNSREIQPTTDEVTGETRSSAVPPVHHQEAAKSSQNKAEDYTSSATSKTPPKNSSLSIFNHFGSKSSSSFQSLSMTTESFDEFQMGNWCYKGSLNLEESPSEESDALREAYRSLGLGDDLQALQEQRDHLEVALQHTQEQLQVLVQENARLKLQLRKQAGEQESVREKFSTAYTCDGEDQLQSPPTQEDDTIVPQDDLVRALNEENRALADRIQELLAHIERREEEIMKEQTQMRERLSRLEEDGVKLEQENQEQGCLISELTKKTEDDLNTIMELQQKLAESIEDPDESPVNKQQCRAQWQSKNADATSGGFLQNNFDECVDTLVAGAQLMFSQETDTLTTGTSSGCQHNNHPDSLQNSSQNSPVAQLPSSAQNLKTQQEELTGLIHCLKEQQREASLSIQTQTEEKQQLTRTIWGLKEEKDCISQSVASLKHEKEQLSRTVCVLKDERGQFIRSMSGLKEEKEHLMKSVSALEGDKKAIMQSLSSGKEERDQIMQSLQSLQTESDRLSQEVLYLKQERDKLNNSLKCLKEDRDQGQLSYTLTEDHDSLMKSISCLKEEKGRTEHTINCLKQEEKQIMLVIQGLKEERNSLQTLPIQPHTEDTSQKHHLLNPSSTGVAEKTETEQSDLRREIDALDAELKKLQEEVDKSQIETERFHSELCQSEARREEAERKATQSAEQLVRLIDTGNQLEETRVENDSLTAQVKELQGKLTNLLREKTDALSLKARIEEQYNILTAQLKAKTVALEELNSEYIALKRGQGSRDDLSTVLVSLRARYDGIRAKYDALLKRKSQTDLDIAPLKAKLSCLVVKCQERNSLLVQMMRSMRRGGPVDPTLTQQVELLLSDTALQDYTAAFTPGNNTKPQDYCTKFTPDFFSKFEDYSSENISDQYGPVLSTSANKQRQNGATPESDVQCSKSEKRTSVVPTEFSTNPQDCSREVTPAPRAASGENANSPVPTSAVRERAGAQVSASPAGPQKQSPITTTAQLSPSDCGPVQATSRPETFGCRHPGVNGKSCPDRTRLTGSSPSPNIPSSSTRVSPSRRLSSPEKILSLHEQLQKTLMNSFQAPESRGRGQQPRKSLSLSAPADLNPAPQTMKQNLIFNISHTNSLPVTTTSSQVRHTPAVTTNPAATNKSTTLFTAVVSRSATLSPSVFTNHRLKADVSKMTTSALPSSDNVPFHTTSPSKAESLSSTGPNIITTTSPNSTRKTSVIPDLSDASRAASAPPALRTSNFDVTSPKTTAPSLSTAAKVNTFSVTSKMDGAATAYNSFAFTTSCSPSARFSPERNNKSAGKSAAALDKTRTARSKPEVPAEVRCVEVIQTVGQSSLMIGWERPPLDELGCSNGTFVYGYRVYVDGDFHKSVMSSACTKCILENVDLSVPVHISVQTLGSNGLSSDRVHTLYTTSVRTEQR